MKEKFAFIVKTFFMYRIHNHIFETIRKTFEVPYHNFNLMSVF